MELEQPVPHKQHHPKVEPVYEITSFLPDLVDLAFFFIIMYSYDAVEACSPVSSHEQDGEGGPGREHVGDGRGGGRLPRKVSDYEEGGCSSAAQWQAMAGIGLQR